MGNEITKAVRTKILSAFFNKSIEFYLKVWYTIMAQFDESKHPRAKDGKFTNGNDYRQNTSYDEIRKTDNEKRKKLENKYNSDLSSKQNKSQLTSQEWAIWYKAVAENKALGYWAEETSTGNAILKVENKNSHKLVITSGTFEKPKAKKIYPKL